MSYAQWWLPPERAPPPPLDPRDIDPPENDGDAECDEPIEGDEAVGRDSMRICGARVEMCVSILGVIGEGDGCVLCRVLGTEPLIDTPDMPELVCEVNCLARLRSRLR